MISPSASPPNPLRAGRILPILGMLGGLIPVEIVFWVAHKFELMFNERGVKLSQSTVLALQIAAMGRSCWGILVAICIVSISSFYLWRTGSRALGTAMCWLGALGAVGAVAYLWLLCSVHLG